MQMDENFLKQVFAEMKAAQGQAIAILTQALCQQLDPARLKADLEKQIAAAKLMRSISPLAIDMATHAMAAAEAEKMLQARAASEVPHPKREG